MSYFNALTDPASLKPTLPPKKVYNDTVFSFDELDYQVGGVPVSWLNVSNYAEAVAWYQRNCPYLPDALQEHLARVDLERKVLAALDQENLFRNIGKE